jgi:hypothetical protein
MAIFGLLTKMSRHQARLPQQFARRVCVHVLHHRQEHSSSGFGIGLGVVMVKLMANVCRQSVEAVAWQFRPDAPGEVAGAKIIKLWSGQTEMIQSVAQMVEVEGGIMRNHEVGAVQPGHLPIQNDATVES